MEYISCSLVELQRVAIEGLKVNMKSLIYKEVSLMSFEEALAELELIINRIDAGQEELEEAVKLFERATLLKKHCELKLQSAKLRIEKITASQELQPLELP